MIRKLLTALCAVAALSATACSDEKKPPQTAPQPTATADSKNDFPDKDPNKGSIRLDPALAKLCNIPTAYFAFDSSALNNDAKTALDALAACFTTGPAKDKKMLIVGHADPRGELEYNFALGQRRAGTVENFLIQRKLAKERIESSSRGELDATGTDEASWAEDRRVDISMSD